MSRRRRSQSIPIGKIILIILLLLPINELWSWGVIVLLLLFVFWPAIGRLSAKRGRRQIAGPYEADFLSGVEFERLLAERFRRKGWAVRLTPKYGDYGADLILEGQGEKVVVQAKRHSSTVGISAVQQVIGAREYYGANEGLVVTNSSFTPNAEELAASCGVRLWDRQALQGFLADTAVGGRGGMEMAANGADTCPSCARSLVLRNGRYGVFWGCSGFPVCRYTRDLYEPQ